MKVREIIHPDLTFFGLTADNREEALAAVSRELAVSTRLDPQVIKSALAEREALGSTSVGNGFAIPHCKLPKLESVVVSLARLTEAVDFNDGKKHPPVRFFFVVLSPPDKPADHLQVLSQIARILKNAELRDELLAATDPAAAIESIRRTAESEGL